MNIDELSPTELADALKTKQDAIDALNPDRVVKRLEQALDYYKQQAQHFSKLVAETTAKLADLKADVTLPIEGK